MKATNKMLSQFLRTLVCLSTRCHMTKVITQ